MTRIPPSLASTAKRQPLRAWPSACGCRLDFSRPFLPDALARTADLDDLEPAERTLLNQIRGHGYAYLLGLVERLVSVIVMRELREHSHATLEEESCLRALADVAGARANYARGLRTSFASDFSTRCDVIGPPSTSAS